MQTCSSMIGKKGIVAICLLSLFSVVAVYVYTYYSPTESKIFPQCPFKLLTGWSCPGCGIQRAIHSLLNGRWGEALSYNYFFVISIPYTILTFIAYCMRKQKYKRLKNLLEHRYLALVYVYCFFAWLFIRNILGI